MSRHAVRIARDYCLAPERVDLPIYGGRYRALFPDLPALEAGETALHALGRRGGPCDLGVDATEGDTVSVPTALIQPMAAGVVPEQTSPAFSSRSARSRRTPDNAARRRRRTRGGTTPSPPDPVEVSR
jgi:hypothetical protein